MCGHTRSEAKHLKYLLRVASGLWAAAVSVCGLSQYATKSPCVLLAHVESWAVACDNVYIAQCLLAGTFTVHQIKCFHCYIRSVH